MILGVLSDDFYPQQGHRWGGSGWARIAKYLPLLPQEWDFHVASQIWPADKRGMSITDTNGLRVYPDVLWVQRIFMPGFHMEVMKARLAGQRVVSDLDDLLWDVPPGSSADVHWGPAEVQEALETLRASDEVMVSTSWLCSRLQLEMGIPSVIVRNTVDLDTFTTVVQSDNPPYIGWAGAPTTRGHDLDIVSKVMASFKDTTLLQHSGDLMGYRTFEDATGLVPDRIVEGTHPQDYPSILTFDIGIIPLATNDFNRAKSDIKGLEYAAAGIPFVASDLPSYKQLHQEWGDVVRLAHTKEEWVYHLQDLLDVDTRRAEGETLRKMAERRNPTVAAKEIIYALVG